MQLFKGAGTGHSPTIINETKHSVVVFLERGTFFNKQILRPGEAVSMTKKQTGGPLPYYIHVLVGDERSIPGRRASFKNVVAVSAIPTAFCVAAISTAMTAGTLAGPSAALAPLVSGMVVKGVVIDAAAITAGVIMADRAQVLSEMIVKKFPENFMMKKGRLKPGRRFVAIRGGVDDGPLQLDGLSKKEFKKMGIENFKEPL